MAEGVIIGAITSVLTDRALSKLVDNLRNQTLVADKLKRLERLLMRIRSTVEVSGKRDIESVALLEWREKLRGAVALGDEVLLSFQQPAAMPDAEAAPDDNLRRRQAMSFTRHAVSSIGRRIGTAVTALFSSDADTKKLDGALEVLEKESENIEEFIKLLQLEASPNPKRRRIRQVQSGRFGSSPTYLASGRFGSSPPVPITSLGHAYAPPIRGVHEEEERLVARLHEVLNQIDRAVTIVGSRDVSSLEWLQQWADLLRDASQQGSAVLGAIGGGAKGSKETAGYDLEEDELDSFVQTFESLAGDLTVFINLASFCPFKASPGGCLPGRLIHDVTRAIARRITHI
ncbi:unnamed protein product [Urochloa decumbens]|uniref:Rx N-terminal domain-containing protein n=1 Tax=Urochloa decumbens TaxID=240449 RepID=A0ABC8YMF8_9POAL